MTINATNIGSVSFVSNWWIHCMNDFTLKLESLISTTVHAGVLTEDCKSVLIKIIIEGIKETCLFSCLFVCICIVHKSSLNLLLLSWFSICKCFLTKTGLFFWCTQYSRIITQLWIHRGFKGSLVSGRLGDMSESIRLSVKHNVLCL